MEVLLKIASQSAPKICSITGERYMTTAGRAEFVSNTGLNICPNYAKRTSFRPDPSFNIPDSVVTKDGVSEYLMNAGVPRDTQAYRDLFAKFSKNLPYGKQL